MEYAQSTHPDSTSDSKKAERVLWLKALADTCRQRLGEQAISYFLEKVASFSNEVVILAVKSFIDQKVARIPSAQEMYFECRKKFLPEKQITQFSSTTCIDFSRDQLAASRFFCKKALEAQEAAQSIAICGDAVCPWHQARRIAAEYPASATASMVKTVLDDWEMAIGDPVATGMQYLQLIGFIPDDDEECRQESRRRFKSMLNAV